LVPTVFAERDPLCNVTLKTEAAVATGLAKLNVKLPDPEVIEAPLTPVPSWKVPALLKITALVEVELKMASGEFPEFP
jgi:hypothetical protein